MIRLRKLGLLLIFLLICSQMVLAGNYLSGRQSVVLYLETDNTDVYTVENTLATDFFQGFNIFTDGQEDNDCVVLFKSYIKFKKKSKKLPTYSIRIKPHPREIDPVTLYVLSKETYSKPYFLSHLQHFLFRLTPF